MILSSTPETNDDPKPWVLDATGQRTSQQTGYMATGWFLVPRPEYDRAHQPNRILVEWRENKLDHYDLLISLKSRWSMRFTDAEVEHAHEVIDRWIEVFR